MTGGSVLLGKKHKPARGANTCGGTACCMPKASALSAGNDIPKSACSNSSRYATADAKLLQRLAALSELKRAEDEDREVVAVDSWQRLTLVHVLAQLQPFLRHNTP
jgi:hypothetical protein